MKQPRPKTQGKVKSSAAEALARAGANLINIVRQRTLNRATTDQGRSTAPALIAECPLPPSAALGSAVRAKGIERELRAPAMGFAEAPQGGDRSHRNANACTRSAVIWCRLV